MEPSEVDVLLNNAIDGRMARFREEELKGTIEKEFNHRFLKFTLGAGFINLAAIVAAIWFLNTKFKEEVADLVKMDVGASVKEVVEETLDENTDVITAAGNDAADAGRFALRALTKAEIIYSDIERSAQEFSERRERLQSQLKAVEIFLADEKNTVALVELFKQAKGEDGTLELTTIGTTIKRLEDTATEHASAIEVSTRQLQAINDWLNGKVLMMNEREIDSVKSFITQLARHTEAHGDPWKSGVRLHKEKY